MSHASAIIGSMILEKRIKSLQQIESLFNDSSNIECNVQ
jgi:hypothetical protein